MTDQLYVPFLRAGDKIMNDDGTVTEWFRNAWNALLLRTGNQVSNDVLGVINGVAQARAEAAAAQASADAASQQANNAVSGAGGSPSFYLTQDVYSVQGTVAVTGPVTTSTVTFTTNGGTGPYTWSYVLLTGMAFTVDADGTNQTTFSTSIPTRGGSAEAVYEVTATDSLAATAKATVSVSAYSESGSGSGGIIP